ncbi:phosphoribosyl-AMP cyclohydrolase [Halomonas salipaludis]|uniref:phosphoribosyl-AMP cyclohydrolase n=1 Tax=Halomonas salipaludis TaxID=2032625 RepID=UPI001E438172|nr:phosphoribosyl-AMP cyclohydrolase [Halomonas salipaludis]
MTIWTQLEEAALNEQRPLSAVLAAVPWNADGLITAIAQQHDSGEVLMLAWMSREALLETLETGQVCYWSRSRQTLWRKGESSGHRQRLVEARLDCDGDDLGSLEIADAIALLSKRSAAPDTQQRHAAQAALLERLQACGPVIETDPCSFQ